MRTYSVAQGIDRCRRISNMGTDFALEYLQLALDELAAVVPVSMTYQDIPAVEDQQEYSLHRLCVRVASVEWIESETHRVPLKATDVAKLNLQSPMWRNMPSGTPRERYTHLSGDSFVVGLFPKPNVGASGGYPLIRVHQSRTVDLASDGNLPLSLLSPNTLVYRACQLYAIDNKKSDDIQSLGAQYLECLERDRNASAAIGFFDEQDPPSLVPAWLRTRGAV